MKRGYLATLLVAICSIASAHADECVTFNQPGNFPNYARVPTPNGIMLVIYPRQGMPLPVKRVRLPDNTMVTGAVPAQVPLSFVFLDRQSTIRAVSRLSIDYVTETAQGNRFIEFNDSNSNPTGRATIPGRPFLVPNTFRYTTSNFLPTIFSTSLTIPGALVMRYCVQPGDRLSGDSRQYIRRLRGR